MSAFYSNCDSSRRLENFFDSGVMGVAVKISDPNSSPWIVDGGSNGGVMKMAGESRNRMGSIGKNVPLIGIAVASVALKSSEMYDIKGHSHFILAVNENDDCPMTEKWVEKDKATKRQTHYGYEIEYTKLFEDSLSTVFDFHFCLSVGGGPGSLRNVVEAIAGNFPVVVIKGTGRVADLICAIREHKPMTYVRNQCTGAFLKSFCLFILNLALVLGVEFERVKKCSS
jgi:hypothetical protein